MQTITAMKLMCKHSCFVDNHRYRYDITDKDWNNGLSFLMGKVKTKTHVLYPCLPGLIFSES